MSKNKPNHHKRHSNNEVNKKAIYWIIGVAAVIIIAMTVLLILQ